MTKKLLEVNYMHSDKMSQDLKDRCPIPDEFHGSIAIELWEVDGKLSTKAVCVPSIVNYILGFGKFKEVAEKNKKDAAL